MRTGMPCLSSYLHSVAYIVFSALQINPCLVNPIIIIHVLMVRSAPMGLNA
jgi:hypothetical protein